MINTDQIGSFLEEETENTEEEVCDIKTGKCYIKTKDGLIERKIIEKQIIVEDGRRLLIEEMPISNSQRNFIR